MLVTTLEGSVDDSVLEAFTPAVRLTENGKYAIAMKDAEGNWHGLPEHYPTRGDGTVALKAIDGEVFGESTDVAKTILDQLGGRKFIVMTGSKNFVAAPNNLSFKVGRNGKGVTHVKITLNSMDEYDLEFYAIRGTNMKVKSKQEGVQAPELRQVFEQHTGLYTSMGTMGQKTEGNAMPLATLTRSHKKGETEYRTTLRIDEDGTVQRSSDHRGLNESAIQDAAFSVWRKLEDNRPETIQAFVEWAEGQGYAKVDNLSIEEGKNASAVKTAPAEFTEANAASLYAIIAEHVRVIPWALVEAFDAAKDAAAKIAAAKAIADAAGQVIEGLGEAAKKSKKAFDIPCFVSTYDSAGVLVRDDDGNGYLGNKKSNYTYTATSGSLFHFAGTEEEARKGLEAKIAARKKAFGDKPVKEHPIKVSRREGAFTPIVGKTEDAEVTITKVTEENLDESKVIVAWTDGRPVMITANLEPEEVRFWVTELKRTKREYDIITPQEAKQIRKDMATGAAEHYVNKKPAKAEDAATEEAIIVEGATASSVLVAWVDEEDWSEDIAATVNALAKDNGGIHDGTDNEDGEVVSVYSFDTEEEADAFAAAVDDAEDIGDPDIASLDAYEDAIADEMGDEEETDESITEGKDPLWAAIVKQTPKDYINKSEKMWMPPLSILEKVGNFKGTQLVSFANMSAEMRKACEAYYLKGKAESFDLDDMDLIEQVIKRRNISLRKLSAKGSKRRNRGVYKMKPAQRMRLARAARKFAKSSKGKALHRAIGAFVKRTESIEEAGKTTVELPVPKYEGKKTVKITDYGISFNGKYGSQGSYTGTYTHEELAKRHANALEKAKDLKQDMRTTLCSYEVDGKKYHAYVAESVDEATKSAYQINPNTDRTDLAAVKKEAQKYADSEKESMHVLKGTDANYRILRDSVWVAHKGKKYYTPDLHVAELKPTKDESTNEAKDDAPYGYCPKCGAKGVKRERRPDGNDVCEKGCEYPSKDALKKPKASKDDEDDDAEESVTVPRADLEKLLIECGKLQVPETAELKIENGMVTVTVSKDRAGKLRTALGL